MNKRQVITLWIIALLLAAAVTFVKFGREQETKSATKRASGQTLFESFPANDIASIDIKGADSSVTLTKKDGKWIVPSRDGFPAKATGSASVNELLRTLGELKVAQGMQAGPSFAPRFGMDESSKDTNEHGITLTFKDASGKELETLTVGKNIESASASASPFGGGSTGRFVRNHADESGFYAVSELFSSLSDQPQSWLAEDFLRVEKIKSISVTEPGKSDIAWKVLRADEQGEFSIEGGAAGETIESATATALKSLFSFSRFNDVVPAADAGKLAVADQRRVATITTFEGFTYTITFSPAKPGETPASSDPENPAPPAEETFLATVAVTADIPKERKKEEGEKEEDAQTKENAFKSRTEELTQKLETENALAPYTFRISKATFEQLVKDRAELTKKPEAADAGQDAPLGGTFRIPPGGLPPGSPPLEAVTEPVEAATPPTVVVPLEEATPAPEKPAEEAPAEEDKPAE